jgi:hypothetical protein
MQASSMKPFLIAELVLTSTYRKAIHFLDSTVPSYLLPKSSSLSLLLATESELTALFITAQEMIPHRQTSSPWVVPNQKSCLDLYFTAAGVTNKTIVLCKAKMMDMQFWWFHCCASQDQFCYYWDAGSKNWANYHTKYHRDTYHKAH